MRQRQAILTVDLGYGDAGKGATVDSLVRKTGAHTVVRFNGGAQAAHNVVALDGRHHTFAQFGSGSFVPGTRTHLSRFMLLDPLALQAEAEALAEVGVPDAFQRTTIDAGALVITPFQRAANRIRELARGDGRHGSCGRGIGETAADALAWGDRVLFAGDLGTPGCRRKLEFLRDLKSVELAPLLKDLPRTEAVVTAASVFERMDAVDLCLERYGDFLREARIVGPEVLGQILSQSGTTIFEAAQGVLLDEWYGFHPYTTWSTTTTANAQTLLDEVGFEDPVFRLGILRAHGIRHGPGPFPGEDAGLGLRIPDLHNETGPWQREVRLGWLDLVALRYALEVNGGVDGLAVTCLDRLRVVPKPQLCEAYRIEGVDPETLGRYFEVESAGVIRGIRKVPRPDLDHQEGLTRLLGSCKAVLRPMEGLLDGEGQGFLDLLEQELGAPIWMTSTGLTAQDRQYWPRFPGLGV